MSERGATAAGLVTTKPDPTPNDPTPDDPAPSDPAPRGGPASNTGRGDAAPAELRISGGTKHFPGHTVFTDLDLEIPAGSFTVLVGPSGCGKSTCLRVLAGLETLDDGRVLVGGADVTHAPARDRKLAMVFQDFALYPHMTVEQNITFGLRLQARHNRREGPSRDEIAARLRDVVAQLRLDGLERRRPHQLSGGQRQRVALARAIVRRPVAFLLDEPLSNLDAQLREQTRAELVRLHRMLATTFVHVTHDQTEAMSMATRLVVMNSGRIAQVGPPEDVYRTPASTFVARFIGGPPMNLHPVTATDRGSATVVTSAALTGGLPRGGLPAGVTVGWRPGHGHLVDRTDAQARAGGRAAAGPASSASGSVATGGLTLTGRLDVIENLGDSRLLVADGPGGSWSVLVADGPALPRIGGDITAFVPVDRIHIFGPDGTRIP